MYANVDRLLRLFKHISISIRNNFPERGKGYSISHAIYTNCIPYIDIIEFVELFSSINV